jgi:hypothetical protein
MALYVASAPPGWSRKSGLYLPDPGLARGLVGHWFATDDGQSRVVPDESPSGYKGSRNPGISRNDNQLKVSGPAPNTTAGWFNQSNTGVDLPAVQLVADNAAVSVFCWIKLTSANNWERLVVFNEQTASPYMGFAIVHQGAPLAFHCSVNGGSYNTANMIAAPNANQWYHVGLATAGTSGAAVWSYVDGVGTNIKTLTDYLKPSLCTTKAQLGYAASYPAEWLGGSLYSVRLYDRQLTDGDVWELYQYERAGIEEQIERVLGHAMVSVGGAPPATPTLRNLTLLGSGI